MDENNINNLSKKLFENYNLEKLPGDFTEKLMVRIEEEKSTSKQTRPLFGKKFLLIFSITFLSIFGLGLFFGENSSEPNETAQKIKEQVSSIYDYNKLLELFNFNLEISLFVKLVIIAFVVLIAIDLVTGSLIDYFLDSKTNKEGS